MMLNVVTIKIATYGIVLLLTGSKLVRCQDDSSEERVGVPIIRQINKVNDDGTYTYGYEAADGSFKIETRDVLGNVKGMFGFIDESGELKRVAYTANNETGFRNSVVQAPTPAALRQATEAGRRPVFILKNTPALHSPTKGPVIQHIPKKSFKDDEEAASNAVTTPSERADGRRVAGGSSLNASDEQPTAADDGAGAIAKTPTTNPLRKILVSKRPVVDDNENRVKGGNHHLRRQLSRGLDLRGEMSHVYSGSDNRYPPTLPPHLSSLMHELRPIQVIRMSPDTVGYQTVDVEAASHEINELPTSTATAAAATTTSTTTEIPYGARRLIPPGIPVAYFGPRYRRPISPPSPDDGVHYHSEVSPHYRLQHVPVTTSPPVQPPIAQLPVPVNLPNANYQTQPHYYEQPQPAQLPPPSHLSVNAALLRDELMAIIYNYLQVRLSPANHYPATRYPPYSPLVNPLFAPGYHHHHHQYTPINYPPPVPYASPYASPLAHYYPPYDHPPHTLYPLVHAQTPPPPFAGPNVQFSSKPDSTSRRAAAHHRTPPTVRAATAATGPADDADLLQMLLTSPTRMPFGRLRYAPVTERLNTARSPPVRNVQIITETTETRPLTTDSPE